MVTKNTKVGAGHPQNVLVNLTKSDVVNLTKSDVSAEKSDCQMSKCISNVLITLEVRDSGRKRQSINDSASCLKKL